jgi:hypothetical protein
MASTADFVFKRHDTFPPLVRNLTQTINDVVTAVNLTTATTVKLIMTATLTDGSTATVTGTCALTDATGGIVTYTWVTGDTIASGLYNAEYEITWNTGKIETIPNDGYFTVEIQDDLG